MPAETVLNVFPTHDERHRLVVAVEQQEDATSRLVLRQETFSDDVGWFVQSRIAVEPEQLQGLRSSLGAQFAPRTLPATRTAESREPAILQFARRA